MALTEKIVLLYADLLHIEKTAEEGGGFLDGVTVSYLYGDNMKPVLHPNGSLGQRPAKAFLSKERWNSFLDVPGLYEGSFDMTVDAKGKPVLKLVDVSFLEQIKFVSVAPHMEASADAPSVEAGADVSKIAGKKG